ncbi:MAG: helix-turn-helix domain-containing protein [Marinilabiliaceae bacterium]|nr:helix-turn-helix domain-containing protein [Marinilabiliaceae bacterium]
MTEDIQDGIAIPKNKGSTKFKGIWIPVDIIEEKSLNLSEKIILAVIMSLSNNSKGICTANNRYFASILSCTDRRIQQILKKLNEKGMIEVRNKFRDEAKNISFREVKYISLTPRNKFHPYKKDDNKDLIITEGQLKKAFYRWKEYRIEINKPLVKSSELASFEKLKKLSNDNASVAEKIVRQTIENGWHSLQALKINSSGNEDLPNGVNLKTKNHENFKDFNF